MKQNDKKEIVRDEKATDARTQVEAIDPIRELFGTEIIFSYSRAQAIADGVLIDVTNLAREAGFRYPVAMTSAAWHSCVAVASNDHVHDETGRLWDVFNVLRSSIRENPNTSEKRFSVYVADEHERLASVALKCLCGPGDDAEPVLTIMLPEED